MAEPLERLRRALADRYAIERELGSGGMAIVYLARDLKHDRAAAIKVVRPEIAVALGAERFLREIRIAAHLQHPHVVALIDSGEIPPDPGAGPGALYYVMPFVSGEPLRERLTREGQLAVGEAVRILRDVLDALSHAHQLGVVHRDIKPENIMLSGRHALVMDFGVARAASAAGAGLASDGTLTTVGLAVGTPAYMAPEQAAGQVDIDARADLYAVGIVAYELLTGKAPFAGDTPQAILAAHLTRTPPPLAEMRPDLPTRLAEALMRCLAKNPADRWPSAEALLAELDEFVATGSGAVPTRVAAVAPPEKRRVPPRFIAVGALAAALLGIWIWLGPMWRMKQARWAREQGIPQALALAESNDWQGAYAVAKKLEVALHGDSAFNALRPRFARRINLRTVPPGALVRQKGYDAPDSAWTVVGRTPLDSVLLPISASGFINDTRIRIESPGRRTLELVWFPFGDSIGLDPDSEIPPEMVRVAGGNLDMAYTSGFEHVAPLQLGDFLMDRYEVTNQEFQRFVDSGGYRRQDLWAYPIMRNGQVVPWDQAMSLMKDRTGRPGPSTWEAGEYPKGQERVPVGGVSWYEAAAYAKFAGKALPTLYHWYNAAGVKFAASVIPRSNFGGQGPVPVGSSGGINQFGTYDMAGNVREWCQNASGEDRFILGGGWNDEPYQFTDAYTQLPLDRSPGNGIRLVRYLEEDSSLAIAGRPLRRTV
ncbi:MAG TPA: bifunctional serine/threonine-protein kinase/formylglycine-generating enzyme family protein, partial [Gemmatimonadales bacterium]